MISTPDTSNQVNLKRLKHAVGWRARYYSDVARAHISQYTQPLHLVSRWYLPLRRRAHALPHRLIVSLTSYPPRFGVLPLTLQSLLRQTVKPDHLILWIVSADFALLPQSVLDLQQHGLEIRTTAFDSRAYKKILPALDEFPEAFIATADDDVFYWSTWLEELVNGLELPEKVVTCHWANEIVTDTHGRYRPYLQWILNTPIRGKRRDLFPVGVGGVLYPPGVLVHQPADRAAGLTLCPLADDVWLYWIGRRNGVSYKTVGRWREPALWHGSQEHALWRSNLPSLWRSDLPPETEEQEYDRQISRIAKKYGYPEVIEQGTQALSDLKMRHRAWMEQHWDFARQWQRFWEPAVTAALKKPRLGSQLLVQGLPKAASKETNASPPASAQGVSVVVCHGGEERLPLLCAALANLRRCNGVNEIIVSDMGHHPWAENSARRWADKYIFVPNEGAFERARCLNAGTSLAECDLVLWLDNDMIVPTDFVSNAASEMRSRRLDYTIPYVAINYLSEEDSRKVIDGSVRAADCRPVTIYKALYVCGGAGLVRRSFVLANGGLSEAFRGWGGEDFAWWHKAKLVGRAEVIRQHNQSMYHLFHANCGANGGSQHRDGNPHYTENLAALEEMRSVRDRHTYLKRFPRLPLFSAAWKEKRVILVSEDAAEGEVCSSGEIRRVLADITAIGVQHRTVCGACEPENQLHPDALVVLGTSEARSASGKFPPELWKKTIVVHTTPPLEEKFVERLGEAGGILCGECPDLQRLQSAGLRPWPIPLLSSSADPSVALALRILQPLSIILGGGMSQSLTQTCSASEPRVLNGIRTPRPLRTLREISILITSFLRTGYLNAPGSPARRGRKGKAAKVSPPTSKL
jgi:hypothetical protein